MRNELFDEAVTQILRQDARYPRQAYDLMPAVLDYTMRGLMTEGKRQVGGHLTGRQLAEGLRDYMLAEYGPFAQYVLADLRIRSTDDIGNLVYNLVGVGALGTSPNDKPTDFHALYNFHDAFVLPFLPRCAEDDAEDGAYDEP